MPEALAVLKERHAAPVPRLALTLPEAAAASGFSEPTLRDEIAAGRLPAKRIGRKVQIPVKALEEWLNTQEDPNDA
jgi:excisionase family DNA binding protein